MSGGTDMPRHVLVLGAYGLIGAGVARALMARGHRVTGLGRDRDAAHRVLPDAGWLIRDLRDLGDPGKWAPLLDGVDWVVNAAGALQDGGADDLAAVQERAIEALAAACAAAGAGLVQISAVGAEPGATTEFMRTKARADAAIRTSGARYCIFRPGLVLAPNSYGSTALIRMLAAFPLILPVARADAPVQSVGLADVARAAVMAIEGRLPPDLTCDLVEDEPSDLGEVVAAHRRWMGLAPAPLIRVPAWTLGPIAAVADLLGRLGWRSPLRSTAVAVLADGIRGDPSAWRRVTGAGLSAMPDVLAAMPATAEHRLAARMALLFPVTIGVLFLFWLLSGLVGLVRTAPAAAVLTGAGWGQGLATASVVFWATVDIGLAALLMVRRHARLACLGMIAVSLFYLAAATVVTPGLWLDPLGPLVKVLPAIVLAAVARAMLETR